MKAEPPASELSLEACKDIESALLRPYVQKNVRYGQRSHWGCLLHYLVWLAKDNFGDGWPNKVIIASSSTLDLVDVMKLQAKAQGIGVVLSTDTHWSLLCIGVGTAAAYLYDGLGCKKTWELAEAVMSHVNERQQCAATALRGDFPRQEDEWSCGHRLIIAFQYFLSSFNEGSWPPAMPAGEFSLVMIQLSGISRFEEDCSCAIVALAIANTTRYCTRQSQSNHAARYYRFRVWSRTFSGG